MSICGIDPGINGGLTFLDDLGSVLYATNIPVKKNKKQKDIDLYSVNKLLEEYKPKVAVIEEVHAFPKQGVVSTFRFGKAFGLLIGLCYGKGIPVYIVPCKTWQKAFNLSGDKKNVILSAQLQQPNINFTEHTASAYFIAKWYYLTNGDKK